MADVALGAATSLADVAVADVALGAALQVGDWPPGSKSERCRTEPIAPPGAHMTMAQVEMGASSQTPQPLWPHCQCDIWWPRGRLPVALGEA